MSGLLYFHQGWTDIINCLPLINIYAKRYPMLYVVVREDADLLIRFYLRGLKNVMPLFYPKKSLDTLGWASLVNVKALGIKNYELIGDFDVGRIDNYKGQYGRIRDSGLDIPFEELFYIAYNIPYSSRISEFVLYRNPDVEGEVYDNIVKNEQYICTHTNKGLNLYVNPDPSYNIIELDTTTYRFFDMIRVLQHAKAIHVIDSVWGAVCYMIDAKYGLLENVPVYVYCHRDFHRMFTNPKNLPNWKMV